MREGVCSFLMVEAFGCNSGIWISIRLKLLFQETRDSNRYGPYMRIVRVIYGCVQGNPVYTKLKIGKCLFIIRTFQYPVITKQDSGLPILGKMETAIYG